MREYEANGRCENNKYIYDHTDISCANGCENKQCKQCTPDCNNKNCGSNGCGGSCGDCNTGLEYCSNGICTCRFEVCNGRCCEETRVCFKGNCCESDCSWKECGDDGCGNSCGSCPKIFHACTGSAYINNPIKCQLSTMPYYSFSFLQECKAITARNNINNKG